MRVSIVQNEIKWGYKADNIASFDALVKTLYHNTDLVVRLRIKELLFLRKK